MYFVLCPMSVIQLHEGQEGYKCINFIQHYQLLWIGGESFGRKNGWCSPFRHWHERVLVFSVCFQRNRQVKCLPRPSAASDKPKEKIDVPLWKPVVCTSNPIMRLRHYYHSYRCRIFPYDSRFTNIECVSYVERTIYLFTLFMQTSARTGRLYFFNMNSIFVSACQVAYLVII